MPPKYLPFIEHFCGAETEKYSGLIDLILFHLHSNLEYVSDDETGVQRG